MTDVLFCNTLDGGDIFLTSDSGDLELDSNIKTATYIALVGGNSDDPGGDDTSKSWWGNWYESNPDRQYRSRTQYLLRSLPTNTANLKIIQQGVLDDLQFLINDGILEVEQIGVSLRRPGYVAITVYDVLDVELPWGSLI